MDYTGLYKGVYKEYPNYGDLNHGRGCVDIVKPYDFKRVLELGSGKMNGT